MPTSRKAKIGVFCGGSGSSKFASAFYDFFKSNGRDPTSLGFIVNVADNFWFHGLYVCPDVDIITYALAGKLDTKKGWGREGDSFDFLSALSEIIRSKQWFNLGDKDLALSVRRTELLKQGFSLSEITDFVRMAFSIESKIIPATDDQLETRLKTPKGDLHLQEFWVKYKGRPQIRRIYYRGLKKATPTQEALEFASSKAIIFPANPISSIYPSVNLKGMQERLRRSFVVAISPFIGKKIISGPAVKMMRCCGIEASSFGVANLYRNFLRLFFVDFHEDKEIVTKIRDLGIECVKADIVVRTQEQGREIARKICEIL